MLIYGWLEVETDKSYVQRVNFYDYAVKVMKSLLEIMNALFNDYITNIVDKAYHRLLTSDNVSKFRPEIIERLEAWGHSKHYISETSEELAALREITPEQAEEQVFLFRHIRWILTLRRLMINIQNLLRGIIGNVWN